MSAVVQGGRARPSSRRASGTAEGADGRTAPGPSATATGIVVTVATLNVVGLVMVLSSGSVASLRKEGSAWDFMLRQGQWSVLGVIALVAGFKLGPTLLRRLLPLVIGGTVLLLVVVLIPGIGTTKDGGRRWIDLGPLNLQPAELAKIAMAVFVADLLTRRARHLDDWRMTMVPLALVVVPVLGLVMLEPDMGTTGCIALVVLGQVFASGIPGRHLVRAGAVSAVVVAAAAWAEPYRRRRLLAFADPFGTYDTGGYQVAQSLVGIGSGGPGGVGLGQSRAKWGFLPNAHTDFIFAIISEEGGLAGALFVMGLFVVLAFLGVRAARRAPDGYLRLLAIGITTWLVGQAIINVSTVIGLLPVTGVPLPYVSYGGSALLVSMAGAGILAGIASAGDRARADLPVVTSGPASRTRATTARVEAAAKRTGSSPARPVASRAAAGRPGSPRRGPVA